MSAHADKTPYWNILGNINDTDTSPYLFLKNVIFRHEYEFVHEFFANFVHEFKYEIRTNSYGFFARKIGYVTNGLYCRIT